MAILSGVPGIDVKVLVRGREVVEHHDPDRQLSYRDGSIASNPHAINKYIESEDGAEFAIDVKVSGDYDFNSQAHSLKVGVWLDGKNVAGAGGLCRAGDVASGCIWTKLIDGHTSLYGGAQVVQKFLFKPVTTEEGMDRERYESERDLAKGLGCIEIRFERCIEIGASRFKGMKEESGKFKLLEKSLKGRAISHSASVNHQCSFAHADQPASRFVRCSPLDSDRGPIAVFRFYYRSKDALKKEMITGREDDRRRATIILDEEVIVIDDDDDDDDDDNEQGQASTTHQPNSERDRSVTVDRESEPPAARRSKTRRRAQDYDDVMMLPDGEA